MVKVTGIYPRVGVDSGEVAAVGHAGGVLLTETVRVTGLDRCLSAALAGWRKPLAHHDPAKVVLDLAITLAVGGDAMSDIATVRESPRLWWRLGYLVPASVRTGFLRYWLSGWDAQ